MVCWLNEKPLLPGARLLVKHTTRSVRAVVTGIEERIDVTLLERQRSPASIGVNELATVTLKTASPLAWDPYVDNRETGSFIFIDEATNATVGAGMLQAE